MLTGVHKMQRMALASTFECCYKDGDEFFSHIVIDDETWVSFVNAETKEQSYSGFTQIHQTSRKSSNKHCLPES
jgi:hypothetical protein